MHAGDYAWLHQAEREWDTQLGVEGRAPGGICRIVMKWSNGSCLIRPGDIDYRSILSTLSVRYAFPPKDRQEWIGIFHCKRLLSICERPPPPLFVPSNSLVKCTEREGGLLCCLSSTDWQYQHHLCRCSTEEHRPFNSPLLVGLSAHKVTVIVRISRGGKP